MRHILIPLVCVALGFTLLGIYGIILNERETPNCYPKRSSAKNFIIDVVIFVLFWGWCWLWFMKTEEFLLRWCKEWETMSNIPGYERISWISSKRKITWRRMWSVRYVWITSKCKSGVKSWFAIISSIASASIIGFWGKMCVPLAGEQLFKFILN